jgi:hypothetical protein
MSYTSRLFQREIKDAFERRFGPVLEENIPNEILRLPENNPLIKDEKQMVMEPLYSPTSDVAVGPFSFSEGNLNRLYRHLASLEDIRGFITAMQESGLGDGYNEHLLELNQNPRCFISVEVENSTARDVKHLLGSVTNCSLLAKVGIVIVFDEYIEYAKRLISYLAFVKRVKKTDKELFRNVFVLSKTAFEEIVP